MCVTKLLVPDKIIPTPRVRGGIDPYDITELVAHGCGGHQRADRISHRVSLTIIWIIEIDGIDHWNIRPFRGRHGGAYNGPDECTYCGIAH